MGDVKVEPPPVQYQPQAQGYPPPLNRDTLHHSKVIHNPNNQCTNKVISNQ